MSVLAQLPSGESDVRLAWELVAHIAPTADILRRWSLSYDQLKDKLRDPLFRSMMVETRKIWASELNTKERIRVKAQLLVEDSMLDIFKIVTDGNLSPQARNDAFISLVKIGDLAEKEKTSTGERVTIQINLGGEQPVAINGEKVS